MTDFDLTAVIPAFNEERFVARAIESVLSQSVRPIQVLIIDDGSTDRTAETAMRYKSDGVEYVYQKNAGLASARNKGINLARGKFIGFLDADDEWKDYLLEDIKIIFEQHPTLMWACAPFERVFENGETDYIRSLGSDIVNNGMIENYFKVQSAYHFSCSSSMVINRQVFKSVGEFDTSISQYGEDLDMWFRIALKYPQIGYSSRVGAVYWQKEGSIMSTSPNDVDRALRRIHKSESHAIFAGGTALWICEPVVLDWVWSQTKEAAIKGNHKALRHISRYYGRRLPLRHRLLLDLFRIAPIGFLWSAVRKMRS